MKKILLSILLLFTLCTSFAQIPFNGSLLIKSGLKKNTIVYGTDTLKFGWESGNVFSISKSNGQRLAKFNMNDSSTIIYNKLILESPNDTVMLSVRGNAYVQSLLTTENIVVADSLMYNTFNIDSIVDTSAITTMHKANFQVASPSYDYFIDAVSEFKFYKGDIVNIYDTINKHAYINILIDSTYINKGNATYNIAPNTFISCCGDLGYVEKVDVDVTYDTTNIINVTDLLTAESIVVGDSVLVINSANSTSVFNGNAFINDTLVFSDNSKQWTAWIPNVFDTGFVKSVGDTMYGDLTILGSDLFTENIVVADSLLYNTASTNMVIDSSSIITALQITFARDGVKSDYLTLTFADINLNKGDYINIYDTINNHTYHTIEILDAIATSPNDRKYIIALNTFIDIGGALGYVEKLNISYDTTKKIVVDGVFEMADSVLVVNSSDSTSIFNGKVIMQNPTDTMLSVRGNARVDTLFYTAINPAIPAWFSNGNTGTDPSANFIGTTDTGRLVFKINNVYSGTIDSTLNYANRGGATHFGYRSGQKDTIWGNSFFGYFAGSENTGGMQNVGVGAFSLSSNIIGEYNTAVGQNSMRYTTGGWNTAIGQASLQNNIDGEYNTFVGEDSYQRGFTGSYNSGLGAATLNNCSGNYNTSLGNHSGNKLTTGSYNLFVGNYAGYWGNWNYKGFIDVIDRGDSASQLTSSPIVIDFNADSSLQKTTFNSSVTVNDTAYLSTTTISGRLNVINAADTAVVVNGNLKADTIFGVTQMPYQSYVVKLTENLQWANSGPLVVGETYRIDALNAGDDFSNVGYMMPEMSFVATGTTPTNWSNGTYILNVTQSNPIVTVLYNSIGNVAWKYSGSKGSYRATFSDSYDINKIAIFPGIPTTTPLQVITQGLTTYEGVGFFLNSYLIDASLNSYQADGVFTDYMIEVRIYP